MRISGSPKASGTSKAGAQLTMPQPPPTAEMTRTVQIAVPRVSPPIARKTTPMRAPRNPSIVAMLATTPVVTAAKPRLTLMPVPPSPCVNSSPLSSSSTAARRLTQIPATTQAAIARNNPLRTSAPMLPQLPHRAASSPNHGMARLADPTSLAEVIARATTPPKHPAITLPRRPKCPAAAASAIRAAAANTAKTRLSQPLSASWTPLSRVPHPFAVSRFANGWEQRNQSCRVPGFRCRDTRARI